MSQLSTIFGLSGPRVTSGERAFFRDADPWAFILFARNIETPEQVKTLTDDLRNVVGRNCLIFVDQEGGRVQRLRPPHWSNFPSLSRLADLYVSSKSEAREAVFLQHRIMADDLRGLGITANCAPVLDLPLPDADPIISDRALGQSPDQVIDLAHAAMAGLMSGGVAPVIKHIPGHGRAMVDSHLELPRVETGHVTLRKTDYAPFGALKDAPMAMTAHIVYEGMDRKLPLTLSNKAISYIIRTEIGFDGLLMSDDLDMKALSGDLTHITEQALAAGCDMALQCSGNLPSMVKVAKGARTLDGVSLKRARLAELSAEHVTPFDRSAATFAFRRLVPEFEA